MKNSIYPFLLIAILEVGAELAGQEQIVHFVKPLLMPALAFYFYSQSAHLPEKLRQRWLLGLGFSTLGDILLMFAAGPQGLLFFALGLSAFLLAHLCYIAGISSAFPWKNGFVAQQPRYIIPFALYLFGLLFWVMPGIDGVLKPAVVLYGSVISTMAIFVANTANRIQSRAFLMMMLGAALFVLSDSMIAVNKFGFPFPYAHVAIMMSYILGQYGLVKGLLRLSENVKY